MVAAGSMMEPAAEAGGDLKDERQGHEGDEIVINAAGLDEAHHSNPKSLDVPVVPKLVVHFHNLSQ